jgi:hypothetical protein
MEQIKQLKVMRDAAQDRLRANPDFKLKNSLDALIDDLEAFISSEGSGVTGEAVSSDPQEELVASDDEEEQQREESYIEPVTSEHHSGSVSYNEDEQADSAAGETFENNNKDVEDSDIEDSDIAAALAQNISAEDIHNEQDSSSDFVNSSQLDMEAEAAIEALEAELAQSDSDVNRS